MYCLRRHFWICCVTSRSAANARYVFFPLHERVEELAKSYLQRGQGNVVLDYPTQRSYVNAKMAGIPGWAQG